MKKKEQADEQKMNEIYNENRRMSEPLKKAQKDVESLNVELAKYKKEKVRIWRPGTAQHSTSRHAQHNLKSTHLPLTHATRVAGGPQEDQSQASHGGGPVSEPQVAAPGAAAALPLCRLRAL